MKQVSSMGVLLILTLMSYYDLKEKAYPLWCLGFFGFYCVVLCGGALVSGEICWEQMLLGLLPGGFLLLLAGCTGQIGIGDGLALCSLGLLYGWRESLIYLFAGLCLSAVYCMFLIWKRRAKKDTRFAFLPFLEGGYILCYILGV